MIDPPDYWDEIDCEVQEALISWYNRYPLTEEDYKRLYDLHEADEFTSYHCQHCDNEVRYAQTNNWDHFQGASELRGVGELCEECYTLYLELKDLARD